MYEYLDHRAKIGLAGLHNWSKVLLYILMRQMVNETDRGKDWCSTNSLHLPTGQAADSKKT